MQSKTSLLFDKLASGPIKLSDAEKILGSSTLRRLISRGCLIQFSAENPDFNILKYQRPICDFVEPGQVPWQTINIASGAPRKAMGEGDQRDAKRKAEAILKAIKLLETNGYFVTLKSTQPGA